MAQKKGTRWEMLGEGYVQDTQIAAAEVVAKVQHFCWLCHPLKAISTLNRSMMCFIPRYENKYLDMW